MVQESLDFYEKGSVYMIQIAGIFLFIVGILIAIFPAKIAVEPQNKKQIAKGKAPMTEEEFTLIVKKTRKSGIFSALLGAFAALSPVLIQLVTEAILNLY